MPSGFAVVSLTAAVSCVLPSFALVLVASRAVATDRFYPDQVEYSPRRTVRLEARSPDNDGFDPERPWDMKPFQDDFTYTLYRGDTNEILWQRRQEDKEASPTQLFADDSGWAVIRTDWEQLLAVDPKGTLTVRLDLLDDALTASEERDYVTNSTAGIVWGGLSLWYFADLRDRPCFCVRTGWGRRILVDLEAAELITADEHGLSVLQARERNFAMAALKEATSFPAFDEDERVWFPGVRTAVWIAAQMELAEAVPLLRRLESYPRDSGGRWVRDLKKGAIERDQKYIVNAGGTSLTSLEELRQEKAALLERRRVSRVRRNVSLVVLGAVLGLVAIGLWCRRRRRRSKAASGE